MVNPAATSCLPPGKWQTNKQIYIFALPERQINPHNMDGHNKEPALGMQFRINGAALLTTPAFADTDLYGWNIMFTSAQKKRGFHYTLQ